MCSTVANIFKPLAKLFTPKIPKSVKTQNKIAAQQAQDELSAAKAKVLEEREDAAAGGIRMLIGGGLRGGFR